MTLPMQTARPALTIVHDATVRGSPQDKSRWTRLGFGWMTQHSLATSRCVSVSSSAADDIRRHFKVTRELGVLYPIAPSPVAPSSRRDNYVLFLGTESPRKNFDVVARAKQLVGDRGPDVVVVGKGHEHVDAPGIRTYGFLPESDLSELRARAKAVVSPSLAEGFDLPVVEAVAAGTPVIASRIDVHQEVLGAGHPYFFEPQDAHHLAELMIGPLEASDQALLDRFSASRVARQAGGLLGLHG
jgi:glycosyltransferase involved in cell wall biosynthesis